MSLRPDLVKMNKDRSIHNMEGSPTYVTWKNMKSRCLNPNDKDYPRYGGRGIKVCDRWMTFKNFLEDMGVKPEKHQIDRTDNNLEYSPENCRWVTGKQNSNNRRSNTQIEFNGKSQTLSQWAEEIGIGPKTLRHRIIIAKWPLEKALKGIS